MSREPWRGTVYQEICLRRKGKNNDSTWKEFLRWEGFENVLIQEKGEVEEVAEYF